MNEAWAPDGVPPPLRDEETEVFEITQDEWEAVGRGEYGRAAAEWTPDSEGHA